jgi:CDP-diacylglycerol--serine O-phosphatidyltransferase
MTENYSKQTAKEFYLLPNLFTISALFAGFYAIISAMNGNYRASAIAIFVSMIFDALDGRVARLTNTHTPFGAELDSLSDMISFGITPALAMYSWSLQALHKIGWLAAFIYAVATALRLARFNTQLNSQDKNYFTGLPSPAAAGVLASLLWVGGKYQLDNSFLSVGGSIITVILASLMVSSIRYNSFKNLDLFSKVPFIAILGIVFALVVISVSPAEILLALFSLFAVSGLIRAALEGRPSQ